MKIAVFALAATLLADDPAPKRVDWVQLRGYNYRTGRVNADAKSLDGAVVKLIGFMVPFDDDQSKTSEFLLVPQVGQCIHIPPPPPNQIVLVQMEGGRTANISWDKPVWVTGRMQLGDNKSPYGKTLYRMSATRVDVVADM